MLKLSPPGFLLSITVDVWFLTCSIQKIYLPTFWTWQFIVVVRSLGLRSGPHMDAAFPRSHKVPRTGWTVCCTQTLSLSIQWCQRWMDDMFFSLSLFLLKVAIIIIITTNFDGKKQDSFPIVIQHFEVTQRSVYYYVLHDFCTRDFFSKFWCRKELDGIEGRR